tara:strand:- start:15301 stop:16452 length:1152 start_codon:yes stop_codon:yes gene_type:complete
MKRRKIFIDGGPLAEEKMSGVGASTLETVRALALKKDILDTHEIHLLIAANKRHLLDRHHLDKTVHITPIYIKARIINGLTKFNILPPMDLLFGRGVYIFPNFKNWPLLFSKSVTYVHDVAFRLYPQYIQKQNLLMLNASIERYLKRTDAIVTVSNSSKNDLLGSFPELSNSKVHVVHNGVDRAEYNLGSRESSQGIKDKYNLPEEYFLFISNLEPRKNVRTLLNAFELFADENASVGLVLVGGMGWNNEDVYARIDTLKRRGLLIIKPNAYVPDEDLPGLIAGSIALVHPAHHEGFGMSPLQAIACGTPVVVSDIPSLREVIGDVGVYLKDINNARELSGLMKQVYNSRITKKDRELLSAQADKYQWKDTITSLVDVIKGLE